MYLIGTITGKFCGKYQLSRRRVEITLIVWLFIFLNNGNVKQTYKGSGQGVLKHKKSLTPSICGISCLMAIAALSCG